jgi:glucokinase
LFQRFLDELKRQGIGRPEAVCLGVAGPVESGHVKVTNLPWEVDAGELSLCLDGQPLRLINDFAAVGYGIEALADEDIQVLQAGIPVPRGVRAVLGAGTGLGQAILAWQDQGYEVLTGEGGHADFAPTDELQVGLLRFLRSRLGRACWENVLSGPGLANIYEYVREHGGATPSAALEQAAASGDTAAAVSDFALTGKDAVARQALDVFVEVYGAQAGNLALSCLPRGGLYVAGGIAPRILPALVTGAFLRAFRAKGPMSDLLASIPVRVVKNPAVGLLGAALTAARLIGGDRAGSV